MNRKAESIHYHCLPHMRVHHCILHEDDGHVVLGSSQQTCRGEGQPPGQGHTPIMRQSCDANLGQTKERV